MLHDTITTKTNINKTLNSGHGMKILTYIIWLAKEILISGLKVTKIIWSQKISDLSPVMDFIATKLEREITKVIYANSITLTPGTISVFLDKNKILVHSLSNEGLYLDPMEQRIKKTFE